MIVRQAALLALLLPRHWPQIVIPFRQSKALCVVKQKTISQELLPELSFTLLHGTQPSISLATPAV